MNRMFAATFSSASVTAISISSAPREDRTIKKRVRSQAAFSSGERVSGRRSCADLAEVGRIDALQGIVDKRVQDGGHGLAGDPRIRVLQFAPSDDLVVGDEADASHHQALEDYSEVVAYAEAIASNSESVTQLSDPLPAPLQTLDVGGSEEVPLYSLVDDEPPPQTSTSRNLCAARPGRARIALNHPLNAVSGVVLSAGAGTPSFVGTPLTLSPEPLSRSPRTSLAMPEVASYPMGKTPEDVKDKSYAYSAEVSRPEFSEKSSSYPSMEASSSSRTPHKQVPSYRRTEYYTTQDIPRPPSSPEVSPHNDSSAKPFSTTQPPVLPLRRPVVSTPAPITASAPPPITPAPPPITPAPPPMTPAPSSHQQSRPSLPPRASPPSSAGTPRFVAPPARTTSQTYHTASPVPLPSPPLPRRSRGPSVPSAPSTGHRPAEFRLQLPPDVSPTSQGQALYQSPHESFQSPAEFRSQVSPAVPLTLQGQAPYQSPRKNFQPPAEFRPQVSPAVPHSPQGYAQAPYQSPRQNLPQASPPPPPQHSRAPTSRAQPAQSSRGTNIVTGLAGGVLGLLGGAVLRHLVMAILLTISLKETRHSPETQHTIKATSHSPETPSTLHRTFKETKHSLETQHTIKATNHSPETPSSAQTGHPTQQTGQFMHPMASQPAQPPTNTPFSQYHPSVNPASQQGTHPPSHHHASPQSSHMPHTQNPHMNRVAYPSFGTSNHTMSSQGPPIPAQYAVNHSHGTAPHHAYSPQSQAGYSVHPAKYQAQGNLQQSHTGQQPPSASLNKTMLAKQFVKGALIAGNVFANLSARNGNENAES
ncbi:hypothetical protein EDD22DRAFT_956432 [Suillus occidentalis]|nr:hypothetical protein EDD22DRAFT_956432 [Suillus occidentalis]